MALKECKECGKEVSSKAKTCPNCGVDNPTTSNSMSCIGALVLILVIGWVCSNLGGGGGGSTNASDWRTEQNTSMAWVMMQDFVEDRLRSPSTAEFPYSYDADIEYEGSQTYKISSYVDSQNGFGATIRTNFAGKIRQTSEDKWTLVELEFEE